MESMVLFVILSLQKTIQCIHAWPEGHHPYDCLRLMYAPPQVFLALLARHYTFTADTNTDWSFAIGKVPKNRLPMTLTPLA
jgi:hypothetical protein